MKQDNHKTDFEMIFENKDSLAQKSSPSKKNAFNEIKKLEKETETGTIDLEESSSEAG